MAVLDILPACVSSVYFMYDKEWDKFSFGKVAMASLLLFSNSWGDSWAHYAKFRLLARWPMRVHPVWATCTWVFISTLALKCGIRVNMHLHTSLILYVSCSSCWMFTYMFHNEGRIHMAWTWNMSPTLRRTPIRMLFESSTLVVGWQ